MEHWHGDEDLEEALRLHYLAIEYNDMSDYPKALEYDEKSLSMRLKLLGEENVDTATIYNYMGEVYFNMGKYP